MKTTANKKPIIDFLSVALIVIVIVICYLSPVVINFAAPVWYENLFWEECVKQDEQIPSNTELLISACTDPRVRGVPDGEMLFVHEKKTGEIYLLDLRTGKKKKVPNDPVLLKRGIFLSSELVWLEGPSETVYSPHYVLDLADGQKYELVDLPLEFNFNTILDNGDVNPDLFPYFTEAEQVFVIYDQNVIIALAPNFRQNLKRSVYFDQASLWKEGDDPETGELLVKLLKDLQVNYKIIDFYDYISYAEIPEIPSPTGKYVVRNDGIYYAGTNTSLILEYSGGADMSDFVSWYYDERSIVLALRSYSYSAPWGWSYSLPRPVLKLNLPIP